MTFAYEVVNLALMLVQEWLDVLLVGERGALRTRHDQVKVDEEADPRVEGHPAKNEVEDILDGSEDREHNEVDQPGCEQSWVGGVESFVGGEYGEKNGGCNAVILLASCAGLCMVA